MTKTVYVVGGDPLVEKMFEGEGWAVVSELGATTYPEELDLICFTGGEDIHPRLYGEEIEGAVGINELRDAFEEGVYYRFRDLGIPMVGICRGGQFLNVMNGGRLIQDHGLISGIIQADDGIGGSYYVHVDHHQGIIPTEDIIADIWSGPVQDGMSDESMILYAGFYPDTHSLCFQPHPEWGHEETENLFFNLIEEYIG